MQEPEGQRLTGPGPASAPRDELADRARRLFDFLAEAQLLRLSPVRSVDAYEREGGLFWLGEAPRHPAVGTALAQDSPEPGTGLLVARRVQHREPPVPSEHLAPWLDGGWTDPERPPELLGSRRIVTGADPPGVETVLLEEHPDNRSDHESWRRDWNVWAQQELEDRPARRLYQRLFAARTTVAGQPEEYELVLGIGLLAWAPTDHEPVRRHLLTTPAEITFDEATGDLTVLARPDLDALTVELDMLDPDRRPAAQHWNEVVERARNHQAHPLDRQETGDLLRRLVHALDPDAAYDESDVPPPTGTVPIAAFAPAIVLRRRSRRGLMDAFQRISAAIAESGEVPAGLLPLLDPDRAATVEPDPAPGGAVDLDGELLLPLPLNARQLEVVRKVDHQAQTLVQGPPGTGKTHLVAALLSHLLAQGRRILVTAQTDRALQEVRDKLPEEIRPLAVAVVGTDRSDLADLKVAVRRISDRSHEADARTIASRTRVEVEACLARIDELSRRRAELRQLLVDARRDDATERSFLGCSGTLAAIAQRHHHLAEDHRWLLEHLTPDADRPSPLTDEEAALWLERLRDTGLVEDGPEAAGLLPDPSTVPEPEEFVTILERRAAGESGFAAVAALARHPAFEAVCSLAPDVRSDLQSRMKALTRRIGDFENRRERWMITALADLRTGRAATWTARSQRIEALLEDANRNVRDLDPATPVTIAPGCDRTVLEALARNLLDHVRDHGPVRAGPDGSVRIGRFSPKVIKNGRPLFDTVRVGNRRPVTAELLTAVLLTLEIETQLEALDSAWPSDVVIPPEDTPAERVQWHATEFQLLRSLLAVGHELAEEQHRFDALGLAHPDWNDLDSVLEYARLVDAAEAKDVQLRTAVPVDRLAQATAAACRPADAAAVCSQLHDAVLRRDREAYAAAHRRTRRLHTVRRMVAERDALTGRVAAAAPRLADAVVSTPSDETWTARLPVLAQAWDWARTGAWIRAQGTQDPNELLRGLDETDESLRHEIERLAATRAWGHALAPDRLTGQARADLNQYVQLVKQFGRTGGKFAARRQEEIREVMNRCRSAVPVWIMPIYRIAEQLPISENMFDVVIVDEASQAGLEATFLQYLAPRIVVVGDDKQVSPSAVGLAQQPLRDLADRYLHDNRYLATWQEPKVSLFDAASIWYGSRTTLVEHRRCVPEIIGFSNRIAYEPEGIRLVPVRQFGSERLDPVVAVHVPGGYESGSTGSKTNRPEAEAIVEQIEKCLTDQRYEGRTIGVISLLGPLQAKIVNNLLLERLTPEQWTAHDLRCGDATAFQGSERDVMFLSMVSAPEPGTRARALTAEGNLQRYNVAASRAKDQMWVFHTVQLDQLTNPEDMRFKLLDYCYHGVAGPRTDPTGPGPALVPEDRRVEPFDSLFEQRVHNRIVERGYTVVPQFDSMGYRIDLVVMGAKNRLAVECDGDHWHGPERYLHDLARERDLRRCGWDFFRLRESAFYVDGPVSLSGLWTMLDELGIRPAGRSGRTGPPDAGSLPTADGAGGTAPDGNGSTPVVPDRTVPRPVPPGPPENGDEEETDIGGHTSV